MDSTKESHQPDASLLLFLRLEGKESEDYLAQLVSEQTEATISGIVKHKLRVSLSQTDGSYENQEALDIVIEVQASLVATLRTLRTNSCGTTITNLTNYAATVSFNACNKYLRKKYPRRWGLKSKLRYLLTHEPAFNLWETEEHDWLCGFKQWTGTQRSTVPSSRLGHLRECPDDLPMVVVERERSTLVGLSAAIFQRLDAPVLLDELVTLIASTLGIVEDRPKQGGDGDISRQLEQSSRPTVLTELEQRAHLEKVWKEICDLPLRHRSALLLNLRDKTGADTLAVFSLTRVATIQQIAEVLAFPPEHFASVWNQLPWDDARIAKHLGLTRQQIINLRHSARSRLARRLKPVRGSLI